MCIPWGGTGPWPKAVLSLLDCSSIVSASIPFPNLQLFETSHPKGNQSWIFIGSTDAEAETAILWPPDAKNWLIGKDPDAGKDWRWEEKGTTEDETVGWHHPLDGHEFEQAPGAGDGQGGLVCCSPWGCKESDTTEQLNWTELAHWNSGKVMKAEWSLFPVMKKYRAQKGFCTLEHHRVQLLIEPYCHL